MGFTRGAAVLVTATILAGTALGGCSTVRSLTGRDRPAEPQAQTGIGVNAYLWRASLDTLEFLPLVTADPWGGVITYDWYSAPETPNERFKTTVYILDARLRADALNVTVNKQVRDAAGQWADAAVSPQTETDLENSILTRARQLRLAGG
ncbi:MAG TPA: DUF3576 domain-containing protein [Caulobacteraceae bacterium]|jgi:uncharacterized protein YceK